MRTRIVIVNAVILTQAINYDAKAKLTLLLAVVKECKGSRYCFLYIYLLMHHSWNIAYTAIQTFKQ